MSVLRNQQLGIPFGMAYPLTFGGKTFQENFDYGREIKDNLRNLLLTQKGERRNLDFGTDLISICFQYQAGTIELENAIVQSINEAVETFMSGVTVDSVTVVADESNENIVRVSVDFSADFTDPSNFKFDIDPGGFFTEVPTAADAGRESSNERDNQYGD